MPTSENSAEAENRQLRKLLDDELRRLQRQIDDNTEKIKDHRYRLDNHKFALHAIAFSAFIIFYEAMIILAASK